MDPSVVSVELIRGLRQSISPPIIAVQTADELNFFLSQFGWEAEITEAQLPAVINSWGFINVFSAADNLFQAFEDGTSSDELAMITSFVQSAVDTVKAIKNLSAAALPPGLPFPFDQQAFWSEFPPALIDYLVVEGLENNVPVLEAVLFTIGILDQKNEIPAAPGRRPFIRYLVNWDKLADFITDPLNQLKTVYRWGEAVNGFNHERYVLALQKLFNSGHFAVRGVAPLDAIKDAFYAPANPLNDTIVQLNIPLVFKVLDTPDGDGVGFAELGVATMAIPAAFDGKPAGFFIAPLVTGGFADSIPLASSISVTAKGGFASTPFRLEFLPTGVRFVSSLTATSINTELALEGSPEKPYMLIGKAGTHRLELDGYRIAVQVKGEISDPEFIFEAGTATAGRIKMLRLVFQPAEGDGFITKIFGTNPVQVEVGGVIRWSSKYGLGINGSMGFTLEIPIHRGLGPLEIEALRISFIAVAGQDPKITAGLAVKLQLGPLLATVNNIGAKLTLKPAKETNKGGLFGNLEPEWGFNPPSGIGLTIDAHGFKGGGFLNFFPEIGEYSGGIELVFQGTIALRALGILNTRLPGGEPGFSLIIIITAEFTPIQLGYGFTLIGVGGLIGLNRTMVVEQLQAGVKDGSLNSILFPTDIVANSNRIISDIKRIFPPREGQFVFGPMAKIGWGTPTLLSIELGLLIEIPDPVRIAILGVLRAIIPTEELAILRLQVNFLGLIDFEKGQLSFDASLYDSRLLTFPLTGDMALRIVWKGEANFVLAVGGFHPAYKPPPLGLGNMSRLAISLLAKDNPRFTIECYFAVTSNTVQFGAKVELYAAYSKFNIYGMVAFDALFQFSPFYFIITLEGMVAVRINTDVLFALHLKALLEGPTPWHAKGSVGFSILFWDFSVGFNETWGENDNATLPPIDVKQKLVTALRNPGIWQAVLPPANRQLISVKEITAPAGTIVIHPFGNLRITQKVVPLGIQIQKFGSQKPSAENLLDISKATFGTSNIEVDRADEEFAPAQFFEMKDDEKLSRKSFESHKGGVITKRTDAVKANYFVNKEIYYELKYLRRVSLSTTVIRLFGTLFTALLQLNATAKSKLSHHNNKPSALATPPVVVKPETFGIATTADLTLYQLKLVFATETEARIKMNELIQKDSSLTNELQVLPTYQLN